MKALANAPNPLEAISDFINNEYGTDVINAFPRLPADVFSMLMSGCVESQVREMLAVRYGLPHQPHD